VGDQRFLEERESVLVDVGVRGRGGDGELSTCDADASIWELSVGFEGDFIWDWGRGGVLWGGGVGGICSSISSSSVGSGEGSRGGEGLVSTAFATGFSDSKSEN